MTEAHFQEPAIAGLRIGISGCPQDCAILRLADIGFCGVTRRIGSERAPLYRIYVGGSGGERKTRFGSLLAEVPARHAPEALRRLLALYREARGIQENWLDFIDRNGIKTLWWLLDDLVAPPAGMVIEALFKDWGSDSPYRLEARRREGDG
jgi:sulfite reductase beta subunit-like hemoprotein